MLFTKLILMDESMIFSKLLHKIFYQLAEYFYKPRHQST